MTEVVVVIGSGLIGQAIARRVSSGKHVVLADLRQENADAAAEAMPRVSQRELGTFTRSGGPAPSSHQICAHVDLGFV